MDVPETDRKVRIPISLLVSGGIVVFLLVWFIAIPARLSNLPKSFTTLATVLEDPEAKVSFRVAENYDYWYVDFELEGAARKEVLSLLRKRPRKSIPRMRAHVEDVPYGYLDIKSDNTEVTVILFLYPSQFTPELKDPCNTAWRVRCVKLKRILDKEMPNSLSALIRQNDTRFVEEQLRGVRTSSQERAAFEQIAARTGVVARALTAERYRVGVSEEGWRESTAIICFFCKDKSIDHILISQDNLAILTVE